MHPAFYLLWLFAGICLKITFRMVYLSVKKEREEKEYDKH